MMEFLLEQVILGEKFEERAEKMRQEDKERTKEATHVQKLGENSVSKGKGSIASGIKENQRNGIEDLHAKEVRMWKI
jgi:hypothetical protein